MTKLLTAAAAALFVATPVLAQNGVSDPLAFFAQSDQGDGAYHRASGAYAAADHSATPDVTAYALRHFAQTEDGDGARIRANTAPSDVIVSSSNADRVAFAKAKLHNDGDLGDNR